MMLRNLLFLFFLCIFALPSFAQKGDVEAFYRGVKQSDLYAKLPPRVDVERNFDNNVQFSSENQGCPEEINIGSVDENTDIFGDVEIEVFIGNDVFIDCGRF